MWCEIKYVMCVYVDDMMKFTRFFTWLAWGSAGVSWGHRHSIWTIAIRMNLTELVYTTLVMNWSVWFWWQPYREWMIADWEVSQVPIFKTLKISIVVVITSVNNFWKGVFCFLNYVYLRILLGNWWNILTWSLSGVTTSKKSPNTICAAQCWSAIQLDPIYST